MATTESHADRTDTSNGQASHAGTIPTAIGAGLWIVTVTGIAALTTILGYNPALILGIALAGTFAGVGVRTATTDGFMRTGIGISALWCAALLFTGTAGTLLTMHATSLGDVILTTMVAVGALLVPFGLLTSTVKSYGHGAGTRVLHRYLVGTALLAGFGVLVLAWTILPSLVPSTSTILGWVQSLFGLTTGSEIPTSVVALVVYIIAQGVTEKTVAVVPTEILSPPNTDTDGAEYKQTILAASSYASHFITIYVVSLILAAALPAVSLGIPPGVKGGLLTVASSIVTVWSYPPLVQAVGILTVLQLAFMGFIVATEKATSWSGIEIAEAAIPPAAFVGMVMVALHGAGGSGMVVEALKESAFATTFPGVMSFTASTSATPLVLAGVIAALIASGVMFSMPTMLAVFSPGDQSLTGITAAVIGVAGITVAAVLGAGSTVAIIGGVALTAVLWELGEYTTIAAGEIQPATTHQGTEQPSISPVVAVHAVTTVVVAALGMALAVAATTLSGIPTLSLSAAAGFLIVASLGIAIVVYLLTG